ncbi:hypothetical protein ACEPAI_5927 [Sanghuangporus weigelae]
MTCAFRTLLALISLLAVAQAAPPRIGKFKHHHHSDARWAKRQPADLVVTETRTEIFSGTIVETITETFTASGASSTESQAQSTSASTTIPAPPVPSVVRDVPNQDSEEQGVLFLPMDSLSNPEANTSESPTVTDNSDGASYSSSAPSQTDSTDSASAYAGGAGPAFAAHTPVVSGPLLSAYYPDWAASSLAPENIDMSRLDWIDFAFGVLNQDFSIGFDDPDSSPGVLNRLVSAAHAKGTKVKLSIGGWDGSRYFSAACQSADSRRTLVNNIVNVYNQFKLDGIDIDWEYPGQQGEGNNGVTPQDSSNFLAMLKLLRSGLPSGARITAAVQDVPFAGSDGNPMNDVSGFAAVLDWVNVMNYDVFGSSNNPGPNAPLDNGCHDSSQPQYNARAAISAWTNAKFPANRLMLGVPFYGYLNPSDATHLQHKKRSLVRRQDSGNASASTTAAPVAPPAVSVLPVTAVPVPVPVPIQVPVGSIVGNVTAIVSNATSTAGGTKAAAQGPPGTVVLLSGDGTTNSGQIQFASIVSQHALTPVRNVSSTGAVSDQTSFVAAGGFTRFWDSCSSTPFLSSPYSNQVVTYDDTESLGLKAQFAQTSHILGTAVWDLSGDTPQWDLLNALRRGLGKPV